MLFFNTRKDSKDTKKGPSLLETLARKFTQTPAVSATISASATGVINNSSRFRGRNLLALLKRQSSTSAITSAPPPPNYLQGNPDPFACSTLLITTSTPRSDSLYAPSTLLPNTMRKSARSSIMSALTIDDPPALAFIPYLPFLPEHILDGIASYSNTVALRRMMWTCRALRRAGERGLRGSYADLTVITFPPLIPGIFSRPNPKLALIDTARWAQLRHINQRAQSHIDIYPASGPLLRRLKVEVRTDDRSSGWDLIERFSPQLERLTIHALDELWLTPLQYDQDDFPIHAPTDPLDNWSLAFFFHPLQMSFPNLTTLTIAATARTASWVSLFTNFGPMPNLRTLSLSAFGRDDLDLDDIQVDVDKEFGPFPKLLSLTVSGDDGPMAALLHAVIARSPHIRHLIIYNNSQTCLTDTIRDIVGDILVCQQLVGLAIYGPITAEILSIMAICTSVLEEGKEPPHEKLSELRDLVIESELGYPLLFLIDEAPTLDLPSLERLTSIQRRPIRPPPGMIQMHSGEYVFDDRFTLEDPHVFYDEDTLYKVLDQYPTLRRVQWARAYVSDPFVQYPASMWEKRGVEGCVYRRAKGQSLRLLTAPFTG